MERSAIQEAVDAAVEAVFARRDERSNLDRNTHAEHHQWLAERIAREAERAEFWRTIQMKTFPWMVVALLGSAGTAIWKLATAWFEAHWK